jgi:FkbM family methyltransferase
MRHRPSFARILGGGIAGAGRGVTRLFGSRVGRRAAAHAAAALAPIVRVATSRGELRFWCDSELSAKRALGALRHEPDTLAWIDLYVRPGDHLWDVGANIGVYGLYACLREDVTATCFEPVASTFAILVRNAALNSLAERLTPLGIALSDSNAVVRLYLSNTESGSSMHALNNPSNVQGPFEVAGVQSAPAIRGDKLVADFGVRPPQHLKIDVDGHELQVLEGMGALLDQVRSVWIEMTPSSEASGENARIRAVLNAHSLFEQPFAAAKHARNKLFVRQRFRHEPVSPSGCAGGCAC